MSKEPVKDPGSIIVYPCHPALEDLSMTLEECYMLSADIGISPSIAIGIVMGRVRPGEHMRKRLEGYFGEEKCSLLYEDYNPTRFWKFNSTEELDRKKYNAKSAKVRVADIQAGDALSIFDARERGDVDKWLIVSKVVLHDVRADIYSNGQLCVSTNKNNEVFARRFKYEDRENTKRINSELKENIARALSSTDSDEEDRRIALFNKIMGS